MPWTMTSAISGVQSIITAQDQNNTSVFNNNYYKSILAKGWTPNPTSKN